MLMRRLYGPMWRELYVPMRRLLWTNVERTLWTDEETLRTDVEITICPDEETLGTDVERTLCTDEETFMYRCGDIYVPMWRELYVSTRRLLWTDVERTFCTDGETFMDRWTDGEMLCGAFQTTAYLALQHKNRLQTTLSWCSIQNDLTFDSQGERGGGWGGVFVMISFRPLGRLVHRERQR